MPRVARVWSHGYDGMLGKQARRLECVWIALAASPFLGFTHECLQLGEKRRGRRALTFERLDSIQPCKHRARFVHAATVPAPR